MNGQYNCLTLQIHKQLNDVFAHFFFLLRESVEDVIQHRFRIVIGQASHSSDSYQKDIYVNAEIVSP